MVKVLHLFKDRYEAFMKDLVSLHQLYTEGSFRLEQGLIGFLKEVQQFFQETGASNEELIFAELLSYYHTAGKSFNPETLEKVSTGRRAQKNISAFYCLRRAGEELRKSTEEIDKKLREAREILTNIILSSIQGGALDAAQLKQYDTYEKCVELWEQFRSNEQIQVLELKLKSIVSPQDIYILLDKVLSQLREEP